MRAEVLVALAPLPELEDKDSTAGGRCYNRCSRGVAQPGSAPALGAGGRAFKSPRPDQPKRLMQLRDALTNYVTGVPPSSNDTDDI